MREKLPDDLVDELLAGARTEQEVVGPGGLLSQLTKRLLERAMEVELSDHLGYEPHKEPPGGVGNTRNGATPKTVAIARGADLDRPYSVANVGRAEDQGAHKQKRPGRPDIGATRHPQRSATATHGVTATAARTR